MKKLIAQILTVAMVLQTASYAFASEPSVEAYDELQPTKAQVQHIDEDVLVKPQIDEEPSIATMSVMPIAGWDGSSTTEVTPSGDTYTITTASQLAWVASVVNAGTNTFEDKKIILANDIDLDSQEWTPIGNYTYQFKGTFDGNGKTISNMSIDLSEVYYAGLFGYTYQATIENVNLTVTLITVEATATVYVGALVGYAGASTITDCYSEVVEVSASGDKNTAYVGGLLGNADASTIINCNSNVETVSAKGLYTYAGGLVGRTSGTVTNCYSEATTVSAKNTEEYGSAYNNYAGGLVGVNVGSILNCYSNVETVSAGGLGTTHVGGLVGSNNSGSIANCYSEVENLNANGNHYNYAGGVVGDIYYATVEHCYWLDSSSWGGCGWVYETFELTDCTSFDSSGKGNFTVDNESYETLLSALNAWVDGQSDTTYSQWKTEVYPVFANYVAQNTNTEVKYESLETAISSTTSGDTIILLADVELESALSVTKEVTIDLNGFDIKQTGEYSVISITSSGNLTLNDSNPNSRTRYGYWDTTYQIVDTAPSSFDYTELIGGIIYGGTGTTISSYKYGGGVYVNSATFTMNGGNIAGNTVDYGGGVSVDNGIFTMNVGNIAGNTVDYGGGAYVYNSTFTMNNDSSIQNNKALDGGGILLTDSTFNMNSGTFTGNSATRYGGGVYVYSSNLGSGSTFYMHGGTLSKNTAQTMGDIMYLSGKSPTFTLKTASINGEVYTDDAENFDMTVHENNANITIYNGTSVTTTQSFGDIAYFTDETWTFDPPEAEINGTSYFTLEEAVKKADSGDIVTLLVDVELESALSIEKQVTIDLNGYDIKQTGEYSVISITSSGNLTLNDSNTSNRARYGYWDNDTYKFTDTYNADYTELKGGVIYGGVGKDSNPCTYGGGVYIDSGTFTMNSGTIAGNKVTFYGGGVFVVGGTFTMNSGTITDNITEENGGGIYVAEGTYAMNGGNIAGNAATSAGGGVYLSDGIMTMSGGTIKDNTASSGGTDGGGGVYVSGTSSTFTMTDGTIERNTATTEYGGGGGVYLYNCTMTMSGGTIKSNIVTKGSGGGGVYVVSGTFTMTDGTIESNESIKYGGGVYISGGTFEMEGGTVKSNTAMTGSRIYLVNVTSIFSLKIPSMSSAATIEGAVHTDDDTSYNMTVRNNGANITIDGGTSTAQLANDIAYFTGTTWTFDQASIDFSTIITQPLTGTTLPTTTTVTDSLDNTHNVTVEWSPNHTTAQADTVYTATVTFTDSTLENDQVINTNAGVKVDNQVVTLVFPATEKDTSNAVSILDAKFYSGQLWDTQRSPAYPNTNSTFRLWNLKSPYDHYLKTFDMSNGEYVKFELVSNTDGVMTLASLNDTSLINAFNSYSNSSNSNDGVLVREVLYNANGTEKQVLSDYGLVWALGDEGFLYTAFSGYLKYSGGVGTYVTMDARTSNDTIVYVPESNDPLSQTDIEDAEIATKDGDTTTPSDTTFDLYGKVIDKSDTEVGSATVTITYDGYTYTTTTNADGYFVIPNVTYNPSGGTYTATVQTTGDKLNDYSGTIADKSDPIVLLYDSGVAGTSTVTSIYTVTIENDGVGKGSAYSAPSGTVSVIPGESLSVVFGNTVDGYSISSVSNGTKVDENIYKVSPTSDVTITATWQESPITNLDLTSYVTAPVKKEAPNTTDIEDDQYTGTISWSPNVSVYDANTVYTATVTLTAKDSYTLTGVASNSFTYTGATSVENSADSGVVTIVFPATIDKDDLTASDFKFTGPSNTTYDGSEKAATVESSNVVDGSITVTYTSSDPAYSSTTPPTEVGTYEVSVTVKDDSDYKDVSGLTDGSWKFEITKATHENETTTGSTKYGNEGSVDLSAWYGIKGASLTLDTVTDSNGILMTSANISDEKLKFEFKDDETLIGKTATALIIVSSSNYKDFELTVTLEVLDKLSSNAEVVNFSKTYDGTAVTVEDLEKSVDVDGYWSISSSVTNVSESGIYTIIFTPSNTDDYAIDNVDVLITINPKTITESDFDITSVDDKVYTGSEILPTVTSTLVVNTDYTITYSNNINVSTDKAKVTITAKGNYTGIVEETFSIIAKEITISDVVALEREYNGTTTVIISGTLNGIVNEDSVFYTATGTITDANYGQGKDVSNIIFILTGDDAHNYEIISQPDDSLALKVDITSASINDVTISGVNDSYIETGSEIIPTVVVKDKYGNVLIEGTDYIIEITNNISVGTAVITIKGTGNGNYDDVEKEFTFTIVKDSSESGGLNDNTSDPTILDDDDISTEQNGEMVDGSEQENETALDGGSPDTGDNTNILYLMLLIVIAILGAVWIEEKRKVV